MQEVENVCAACNNVARQRCTGCQAIYYCSREHQKSHWKTHSKNCRAYKLVVNSQLGRHYVATRNIKIGETVLYDKTSLVTSPGYMKAVKKGDSDFCTSLAAPPVCLGCYVKLAANNAKPCQKCGWPLCLKCTKHGAECEFTMKHRKSRVSISRTEFGHLHPAYEIIGVARALALRENDPKAYRKLMNLQDHLSSVAKKSDQHNSIGKAAQFAKIFFNIEDVTVAEISRIFGIFMNNAVSVGTTEHEYTAVYDRSSSIEHNCRANCSKSLTNEGGVVFWAAVPISKGDHITTSYVCPFWGTERRRQYLAATKFFDCTCERCEDPAELGTMFNAIKCTKGDCNGYALPPTFLVTGEKHPDYVCRRCNRNVPRQLSDAMEQAIGIDRATLQTDNVLQYRVFIQKYAEYLHKNNSNIFEVEIELARSTAYVFSEKHHYSAEYLTDIVNLCVKLNELLKILAPAEHTMRGVLLNLKVRATLMSNGNKCLTIDQRLQCGKKLQKDLSEVQELLRREPSCHPFEHSILKNVSTYIDKIKMFENMA